MKKIFSLILVVAMLCVPFAFAEEADSEIAAQQVEDAKVGLSYELPADWIVLSDSAIDAMIASLAETEEAASAFTDETLAQIALLRQNGMSMCMSADTLSSMTILVSQAAQEEEDEDLSAQLAALEEQGLSFEMETEPALFGENAFQVIHSAMEDYTFEIYLFANGESTYAFVFQNCEDAVAQLVLGSVAVVEIAPETEAAEATESAANATAEPQPSAE